MNINEAKQILQENGYELIDEGLLSDIKDKIVQKVKDSSAYNTWCNKVVNLLKTKYRITITELKKVIDLKCFKQCFKMNISPLPFVQGLMKKYVELMNKFCKKDEPEQEIILHNVTGDPVFEAYTIISSYSKTLTEVTDAEMFDKMWEESNIVNQYMNGKIKHLDKLQMNSVCHFLRRKCGSIVLKKLKALKMKPKDMDAEGAGDYAASYITQSEKELKNFLSSNPNTYFTPEILEIIVNKWNKDGEDL